jgi:hypothetical protein
MPHSVYNNISVLTGESEVIHEKSFATTEVCVNKQTEVK